MNDFETRGLSCNQYGRSRRLQSRNRNTSVGCRMAVSRMRSLFWLSLGCLSTPGSLPEPRPQPSQASVSCSLPLGVHCTMLKRNAQLCCTACLHPPNFRHLARSWTVSNLLQDSAASIQQCLPSEAVELTPGDLLQRKVGHPHRAVQQVRRLADFGRSPAVMVEQYEARPQSSCKTCRTTPANASSCQ